MKKTLLAFAIVAGSTQSAFAYWDTGVYNVQSTPNDGELILTIWDSIAQKSYTQDLGVRYSALQNGTAFNGQTISLDATALSIFGSSIDPTTVQWGLAAASNHTKNGSTNAYTGAGFMVSAAQGATPTSPTASTITTGWSAFNGYQVNSGMGDPASVIANEVRSGSAAVGVDIPTGYQSFGDTFLHRDFVTSQFGSGTLDLWNYAYSNANGSARSLVDLGSISLDFTTKTLTIGSVAAPTVPVPAAVWLMGSALTGLGSIARRRRQA